MIRTLVVFGAGGDLTGRLLLPAVAALRAAGALAPDFGLVGADRQARTVTQFADHVRARLTAHAPSADPDVLTDALRYQRVDVTEPDDVAAVLDLAGDGPVAVYLALPTQLMLAAVRAVLARGLPPGSRIAVEKPFGVDGPGAVALNSALAGLDPVAVYRVDHVLAMTAVQALAGAGWGDEPIERVELLFDETLALEGRASFYDRAGALRDVMQNHLVQVLCTLAQTDRDEDVAERRAAVLRTVRPLTPADVVSGTRRARYTVGRLATTGAAVGRAVPDYTDEDGVDPSRATETFAEVVLALDSPTWAGVSFVLRAGKALDVRRRGVSIRFRGDRAPVWIDLDDADAEGGGAEPVAYQRIVADVLSGGSTFAVGAAEAELAWDVFTPVLDAWATGAVPLGTYPAGSAGP